MHGGGRPPIRKRRGSEPTAEAHGVQLLYVLNEARDNGVRVRRQICHVPETVADILNVAYVVRHLFVELGVAFLNSGVNFGFRLAFLRHFVTDFRALRSHELHILSANAVRFILQINGAELTEHLNVSRHLPRGPGHDTLISLLGIVNVTSCSDLPTIGIAS